MGNGMLDDEIDKKELNDPPSPTTIGLNCAFYNETICSGGQCPINVTQCAHDATTSHFCFSLWSNTTDNSTTSDGGTSVIKIKQAGCLNGKSYECADDRQCIASKYTKENYFCCCNKDFCNKHVYPSPKVLEYSVQPAQPSEIHGSDSITIWSYVLIPVLFIVIIAVITMYFVLLKRRKRNPIRSKRINDDDESVSITNQMNGLGINSGKIDLNTGDNLHTGNNRENVKRSIQLIEKLSTGRFGSVWKAKMYTNNFIDDGREIITSTDAPNGSDEKGQNYKIVAVKIFPPHERSSWIIEQLVFKTPQIEHENILRFIGSEKRDEPNNVPLSAPAGGFWLLTEYHELGSLCDYLKKNAVNINQLLKISVGIAAGLNHLHYEIPEDGGEAKRGKEGDVCNQVNYKMKPSIVHRDFKSRNVLLKPDLTPRIADFGLALIFYPNRTPTGLGQVGTRRYMAPEVLEGAINYNQDSLYRIDIYACALVYWELVSRCRQDDDDDNTGDGNGDGDLSTINVGDYKLPFEEEVGQNPSLEDMQEIVCQAKKRPIIQQQWLNHPILKVICETIEECWDQDAEARLSASCILERLTILARNRVNTKIQ